MACYLRPSLLKYVSSRDKKVCEDLLESVYPVVRLTRGTLVASSTKTINNIDSDDEAQRFSFEHIAHELGDLLKCISNNKILFFNKMYFKA